MTNVFNTFKKGDQHEKHVRRSDSWSQIKRISLLVLVITFSLVSHAAVEASSENALVKKLMDELRTSSKQRKYKWDTSIFTDQGWKVKGMSVNDRPLIYWTCGDSEADNSTLILSSVHGDEVTPLYFGFRLVEWLKARPKLCEGRHIVIAPLVNPDGVLRSNEGLRTNANKVDLNRNFDTPDWHQDALRLWKTKYKQRRYYPGDKAASEPETQFQQWLISEFKPSKILSVHSPLSILDYDGPREPKDASLSKAYVDSCEALKNAVMKATKDLKFHAYGIFPGSLGNYAGKQRGIPTFTIELSSADPKLAGEYFGEMETGIELLISQPVGQKHLRADN